MEALTNAYLKSGILVNEEETAKGGWCLVVNDAISLIVHISHVSTYIINHQHFSRNDKISNLEFIPKLTKHRLLDLSKTMDIVRLN